MANFVPSIVIDTVIDALSAFLQPFAADTQIIRAQVNGVPPPLGQYIELTEMMQVDLETPTEINTNGTITIAGPKRIDIQVDFYGPSSGDQCTAVKTVFRSSYAPAQFADGIKPLYCSDAHQAPLTTGEMTYESRWTLTASFQYNPLVSMPQQSATALALNILEDIQ